MDMINKGREWLYGLYCGIEYVVQEFSDVQVMRAVDRLYDGGWKRFLRDMRAW